LRPASNESCWTIAGFPSECGNACLDFWALNASAEEAAEKVFCFVIPSEARDLLFCSASKKQ
jgi:hypothetical protein